LPQHAPGNHRPGLQIADRRESGEPRREREANMTPSWKIVLSRVGVVVLSFWGLLVITPDFARVFTNYATLGFEADNDGVVTVVSGQPAAGAGIRPGDCVDLNQTARRDLLAVFGGMGGMTYVRPDLEVMLYVEPGPCTGEPGHATARDLKAQPTTATPASRLLLALVQLLGVFFIVVAAVLVWQRPGAMTWGFFLYGLWFNPGQYFVFYAELQRYPQLLLMQEVLQSAAQAIGYAGFIVFAIRFPQDTVEARWQPVERMLPAIVAAIFVIQLTAFATVFGYHTELFGRWAYGLGYAVDIAVLLILHFRRRIQSPQDQQRTRWVLWACRVGLLSFIFADSNMATSLWDPIVTRFCTSAGSLASWTCDADGTLSATTLLSLFLLSGTIPVAVFHAIHRHRVIDIRFALSRGTTLLLTSVIIAGVLAAVERLIEELLHESLASQILVTVFIVILLKLLFEWLHELFNHACDRLFFRRVHVAEERLAQVADEFMTAESFDGIDRKLITEPMSCLDLASAAVFRRDSQGRFRQAAAPAGWPGPREAELPLRAPVLGALERERKLVRLSEPTRKADSAQTPAAAIAMPIIAAEGLVAVAMYGAHRSGSDITAEESAMLQSLMAPAGHAYDRVEVIALQREVAQLRQMTADMPYGLASSE